MSRRSDVRKRTVWLERLSRYARSGLTVERFCVREGVSTASFYNWRKRLGPAVRAGGRQRRAGFQAVEVVGQLAAVSTPGLSIHFPNGARIDLRITEPDAVRTVIDAVARTAGSPTPPC